MQGDDWTRQEVEAIVDDYLSMLASELAGTPYNKAAHRRSLQQRLSGRTEQSIEFKHANISAALLEFGFPYIAGYKPRSNYQGLLLDVLSHRLDGAKTLQDIAAADVERPMVVPEVSDILAALVDRPRPRPLAPKVADQVPRCPTTNYIEREARNASLGHAGELFVLNFERARLIHAGQESLAAKIEHTSKVRGDHEGFDVLSYEVTGAERLIEVKTTKYGIDTPFFVTRNEVAVSERRAANYHLYRAFAFRASPHLYLLAGSIRQTCRLSASAFLASPA